MYRLPGGIFHHANITEMFADGFYYHGYNEKKGYINFRECRMHWVKFVNESADFAETALQETDTKVVGWCDASGPMLYVEFFSEPRTRFEFDYRRNLWEWLLGRPAKRSIKEYIELMERLIKLGWKLHDRSEQSRAEKESVRTKW